MNFYGINLDENAMSVHLLIHKFRNQIQGFEPNYGLNYNSKNYGVYIIKLKHLTVGMKMPLS